MSSKSTLIISAVSLLVLTVELLRRKVLREKYAAIWILFSIFITLTALYPELIKQTSQYLGFQVPANLVFVLGIIFLILMAMQLSLEVGKLESESQKLSEEIALLKYKIEKDQTSD